MEHVIKMPHSFEIEDSISNTRKFIFHCMINNDTTNFNIKLLDGTEEENDYGLKIQNISFNLI